MRTKRLVLALLVIALLASVLPYEALALDNFGSYAWYETRYTFESGVYQILKEGYYLTGNNIQGTTSENYYGDQYVEVNSKLQGVTDSSASDTYWYIERCGNSYITLKNLSTGEYLNFSGYDAKTSDQATAFRLEQNAKDKLAHIMLRAESESYLCLRSNGTDLFYFGGDKTNEMKYLRHTHSLEARTSSPCSRVSYWHCSTCGFDFADNDVNSGNKINATVEHTWEAPVVVTQATTAQKGMIRYTCVICSHTEDQDVEKLSASSVTVENQISVTKDQWTIQRYDGETLGNNTSPSRDVHVDQVVSYAIEFGKMGVGFESRTRKIELTAGSNGCTGFSGLNKTDTGSDVQGYKTATGTITITGIPTGGKIVLTATHSNPGHSGFLGIGKVSPKTYISTLTLNVSNHNWGDPVFTWSDDGKTCTAMRTCTCGAKESTTLTLGGGITAQVKTPATCTVKGKTTYTATAYDKQATKDVDDIPALGHTKGQLIKGVTAATCTAEGVAYDVYKCGRTGCNAYVKVDGTEVAENAWVVGKTSHSETTQWKVDSAKKTHYHECSECGVHLSEGTHSFTNYVNTATCTEAGQNIAYCDAGCGTTDVQNTTALGHNFSDSWVPQGETTHARICANDSSHKLEESHEWDEATVIVAPGATTAGKEEVRCGKCGFSTEITIPPLGEIKGLDGGMLTSATDGSNDVTIDLCIGQTISYRLKHGRSTASERNYSITPSDASIVTINPNTVSAAERTNPVFYITASAVGTSVVELKCTEEHSYDVGTPHTKYGVKVTVNVHAHGDMKGSTVTSTTEATCTSAGSISYKCGNCDANYTKTIPMAEHTAKAAARENEVAATCTTGGSYNLVTRCETCNTIMSSVHTDVNPLGHNMQEVAGTAAAPTCEADGKYADKSCANNCGKTETGAVIPAKGHTVVTDKAVSATCTKTGKTEGSHCSVCNTTLVKQEEVKALGHDYKSAETAPTCTVDGYTTHTCSRCDSNYTDTPTDALGHDWVAGETTESTCTGAGVTHYTCSRCDAEKEETGDLAAHTPEVIPAVAPTCTTSGLTEGSKCSVCNAVLVAQETVAANGHTEVSANNAIDATCTTAGHESDTVCSVCQVTTKTGDVIDPLGHDFAQYTHNNDAACGKNATETAACSRCDATNTRDIADTALTHVPVTDAYLAPTCTETGLTEGCHCKLCGVTLTAQETIEALGHTVVTDAEKAPTCTEAGLTEGSHCSVCGATLTAQQIVNPTGHSIGTLYKEQKAATCTEDGVKFAVYSCANGCGGYVDADKHVVTEADWKEAKLGHPNKEHHNKVEATCTEDGIKEYWSCGTCNKNFADEACTTEIADLDSWKTGEGKIEMQGHTWGKAAFDGSEKHTLTCQRTGCGETTKIDHSPADAKDMIWSWRKVGGEWEVYATGKCPVCGQPEKVAAAKENIRQNSALNTTYTATVTVWGTEYSNQYTEKLLKATVTVKASKDSQNASTEQYNYLAMKNVSAPSTRDGAKFMGWYELKNDRWVRVSTRASYTFFVTRDITLAPLYVGEDPNSTEVKPDLDIQLTYEYDNESGVATAHISMNWSLPYGYKLKKAGVYRGSRVGTNPDPIAPELIKSKGTHYISSIEKPNGTFVIHVKNVAIGNYQNALGYIIYENEQGVEQTMYTNGEECVKILILAK